MMWFCVSIRGDLEAGSRALRVVSATAHRLLTILLAFRQPALTAHTHGPPKTHKLGKESVAQFLIRGQMKGSA